MGSSKQFPKFWLHCRLVMAPHMTPYMTISSQGFRLAGFFLWYFKCKKNYVKLSPVLFSQELSCCIMIQVEKNDTLREISSQNVLWSTLLDQTSPIKFNFFSMDFPHISIY